MYQKSISLFCKKGYALDCSYYESSLLFVQICQCSFDHDRALQTLFLQLTGQLVRRFDCAGIFQIIGVASAAAIEFCPAGLALRFGVDGGLCKRILDLGVERLVKNAAHNPLRLADKLVAGIDVALRGNRDVLVAAAAAAQTFDGTRALVEVDHKVEEVEEFAVLALLDDDLGQLFILGKNQSPFLVPSVV